MKWLLLAIVAWIRIIIATFSFSLILTIFQFIICQMKKPVVNGMEEITITTFCSINFDGPEKWLSMAIYHSIVWLQ